MSFRAFSIGFSAALLALACGSEDSNNQIEPPPLPTGEDACRDNPLARDCDDTGGNEIPGADDQDPVVDDDDNDIDTGNDGDAADIERAAVEGILAENCGACHGPNLTEA